MYNSSTNHIVAPGSSVKCNKCCTRIPKTHRKLVCKLCSHIQHYKCQGLSKKDVEVIINTPNYNWFCYDCTAAALPVNAASTSTNANRPHARFKSVCHACHGMSYSKNSIDTCCWCNNICHKSCIKGNLGCTRCCMEIMSG